MADKSPAIPRFTTISAKPHLGSGSEHAEAPSNQATTPNLLVGDRSSDAAAASRAARSNRVSPQGKRTGLLFGLAGASLVITILLGLLFGSSSVGIGDLWALLTGAEISGPAENILLNVRIPRVLAALLSGAALATAGAIIQSALDNPLASPNVIGINSGAGLAVLVAACLAPHLLWLAPVAAFLGAMVTALIIFGIASIAHSSRLTVVLAGIALTTVFGAGMNTILIINPDAYIGSSAFLVGGLSDTLMKDLVWPSCFILGGLVLALLTSNRLNIMALGDERAHGLGMNVSVNRLLLLGLAALLSGAAVSFAGLLGFVGLIIPHMIRFFSGHDNRLVVPLSALFGSSFVILCDLLARTMFAPYEIPVGILMSLLGGPFFIYLILRHRRGGLDA